MISNLWQGHNIFVTHDRQCISMVQCKTAVTPLLKPLSHQGGVLTATARRARKTQNAEVRAVRSPRAPRDRRGISAGRRGVSSDAMPRRALCACTKCAPWLGVPTAIWMSAVWMQWVRSGNAVTAEWGLLGRHDDAVRTQWRRIWSPQERRHILQ